MLNPIQLKTDIKKLLNNIKSNTDQENSIEVYAESLANIIDQYVRSATVTVTGTSATGGAVTGTGKIN